MAHQRQDETKQPPPPPSTETNTTLTTTFSSYLSTHLIVPYFVTPNGEIKRPEHLIAWWSRIFSFYVPDGKDRKKLRSLCRLFRDALKPPPLWTSFPHPNFPTLNGLMDTLNRVFEENPTKAPKIVFVMEGTFHGNDSEVNINYPLMIIGAGQNNTFLSGYGLRVGGTQEEKKRVNVQGMTMKGSSGCGLEAENGLSFLCKDMTFTQCGSGVYAYNTKGRLINCVITQCKWSGIFCWENALIELEGSQTKVDGNVTDGYSNNYGLDTYDFSSIIHLLFPLTQESVSTNNYNGRNCNERGTIATVNTFQEALP